MWTFEISRKAESQRVNGRLPPLLAFSPFHPPARLKFSRRWCLLAAVFVLIGVYGMAAGWLYKIQEIKPNVFVWVSDDVLDLEGDPQCNRAGTAGFVVTSEGIVVVNTTNTPFHGRELLYEIRHRSELPVRYVIDTNSSGEQILGNEVFTDQQAILISSIHTQEQILQYRLQMADRLAHPQDSGKLRDRMRGIHVTPPTQTFGSEMTLNLGGEVVSLRVLLKNGSAEDAVVFLPSAKVLFLGELFQNGYFPRIESRNLRDWVDVLKQVEGWDVEVYVPGHGEPGGKKDVAEFREFLEWLNIEVKTRCQGGESLSQVKREVVPLLDNYKWHAPELVSEEVEAIYNQTVRTSAPKVERSQTSAQVPPAGPTSARP